MKNKPSQINRSGWW